MLQKNRLYAQFLESQGFIKEAIEVYQEILKQNPNDKEILQALKRLQKPKANKKALKFFIKMNENRFNEFEKWLLKGF